MMSHCHHGEILAPLMRRGGILFSWGTKIFSKAIPSSCVPLRIRCTCSEDSLRPRIHPRAGDVSTVEAPSQGTLQGVHGSIPAAVAFIPGGVEPCTATPSNLELLDRPIVGARSKGSPPISAKTDLNYYSVTTANGSNWRPSPSRNPLHR